MLQSVPRPLVGTAKMHQKVRPRTSRSVGPHLGTHSVGEAFLTVSLAEVHTDDFAYKLVAGIIERALVGDASGK